MARDALQGICKSANFIGIEKQKCTVVEKKFLHDKIFRMTCANGRAARIPIWAEGGVAAVSMTDGAGNHYSWDMSDDDMNSL